MPPASATGSGGPQFQRKTQGEESPCPLGKTGNLAASTVALRHEPGVTPADMVQIVPYRPNVRRWLAGWRTKNASPVKGEVAARQPEGLSFCLFFSTTPQSRRLRETRRDSSPCPGGPFFQALPVLPNSKRTL